MDSSELYFNIMADSLNVLGNSDRPRLLSDEEKVFNPNDSILGALVETNHDYIIECLLDSDDISRNILEEFVRVYMSLGKYEDVLNILLKHNCLFCCLSIYEFMEIVQVYQFSDDKKIGFARYLTIVDSSLSEFFDFFEGLINNNEFGLLYKIIDSLFIDDKKIFLTKFVGFVEKGESSMQLLLDFTEHFRKQKTEGILNRNKGVCFRFMLNTFIRIGMSTEDLEILHHSYRKIMETEVFDIFTGIENIKLLIFKRYLDEGKFDQAETYLKKVGESRFLLEELKRKKYAHSIKVGDKETNKELLDEIVDEYNHEITYFEEGKNGEVISSDGNVLPAWFVRIGLCKKNAKKYCEIAIFEIMHGDREKALEYIDIMINYVESISLDIPEGCSKRNRGHIIGKHKKPFKKSIKRRFMDLGLFHFLPRKYGWNKRLKLVTNEDTIDNPSNGNQIYNFLDQETVEDDIVKDINKLLTEGKVNESIDYLEKKSKGRLIFSDSQHWNAGIMILEHDSNSFDRLFKILSKNYFYLESFSFYDMDIDGMSKFLIKAHLLGVNDLLNPKSVYSNIGLYWRESGSCFVSARNAFLVGIISGFIDEGMVDDAYSFFDMIRSKMDGNSRDNYINDSYGGALSLLIRTVSKIDTDSIYHRAFRGYGLDENSLGQQIKEGTYRNVLINIALLTNSQQQYKKIKDSFRKFLDRSENSFLIIRDYCRNFKKLNLRDLHLIKEELLGILDLEISKDPRIRRRVVDTMIGQKIPGVESSVEIKRKDNELKVLLFFIKKLIKEGYLTNQTNAFLDLNWKNNIVYLRILLAQYQNESNSTIDAICYDYVYMIENHSISPKVFWSNVFKVLDIFGMITPSIWAESKKVNFIEGEMKEIQRKIKESNSKLFKNVPISEELTQESQAELIYHAFKPVNMTYDSVCNLLSRLEDCSNHLDRYIFPVEGYELSINERKEVRLRRGKDINRNIDEWINLLKKSSATLEKTTIQSISRALCEAGRFKFSEIDEFGIQIFFLLFRSDDYFQGLSYLSLVRDGDRFKYLQLFYDFFYLYLHDNLEQKILDFFELYSEHVSGMWNSFKNSLNEQKKRKAIESQLKIHVPEIIDDKFAAKVIALSLINKTQLVSRSKKQLKSDIKKYVYLDGSEIKSSSVRLRMYVSKNKASFFAKASAGLCTAEDVYSFHREDHFHINIVDEVKHECLGNLMAYDTIYNGKRILLLRGFNPNISLLRNIEVASYCDGIIEVMKRFAVDNGFSGIYIVDNGTGRGALSNRGEISEYLSKMYGENECEFDFEIVRGVFVNKINPVELFEHHEEAYA